jgi:hypothetical protein
VNQREQKLLDTQLRNLYLPARHDGTVIVAIFAVFFVGLMLGSLLFGHTEPTRVASNEPAIYVPNAAAPAATRQ